LKELEKLVGGRKSQTPRVERPDLAEEGLK